jgi:hypothetical protein
MPTPVSREFLRTFKSKRDEEKRIKGVNERAKHIYDKTLEAAELYTATFYRYPLTERYHGEYSFSDPFYKENTNMIDILLCVQTLFPDCKVTRVHGDTRYESIVIDWS